MLLKNFEMGLILDFDFLKPNLIFTNVEMANGRSSIAPFVLFQCIGNPVLAWKNDPLEASLEWHDHSGEKEIFDKEVVEVWVK